MTATRGNMCGMQLGAGLGTETGTGAGLRWDGVINILNVETCALVPYIAAADY